MGSMTDATELLGDMKTVLVIDWPSRDVPETLARHGFTVVSHEGPGPDEYDAYEADGDDVRIRRVGRPPDRADLVYTHRPIEELPGIVRQAHELGARAVWLQSGLDATGVRDPRGCWLPPERAAAARQIVESGGLVYLDAPYIADSVRGAISGGESGDGRRSA